jgi:tyrosyl-tRNA synthetase
MMCAPLAGKNLIREGTMAVTDTRTGKQDLKRLLKRGVSEIISEQEMIELLRSGRKLRLKEGLDPSAPNIHLGHMVSLRKLRQFQAYPLP